MSIWRPLWQEAQPLVVRGVVQYLRGAISEWAHAPLAAQPQLAADAEGGCPYCAMRTELWGAIGAAVDAGRATEPLAVEVYEQKLVMYLERTYRAGNCTEVVVDPEGAEILAEVVKLTNVRGGDYNAQVRQLSALKERCVTKAIARNGQGAKPAAEEA